jgi:hypothetical protein
MRKSILVAALAVVSLTLFSCMQHSATNNTEKTSTSEKGENAMYECPMKCEPASASAGKCGKCGMDLVAVKK